MLKKAMQNEQLKKLTEMFSRLKNDKKSMAIICAAIFGMLLIMLPGDSEEKNVVSNEGAELTAEENYEEKLQKLLSEIEGTGKVRVMITYESGDEDVFAFNKDESYEKEDGRYSNDYVIIDGEKGETGLKLKTVYPKIKGVAVVCSGASDPVIKEQIVSLISALFDISTKNISVVCTGKSGGRYEYFD